MNLRKAAIIGILFLTAYACKKEGETVDELDVDLNHVLADASNGGGPSYYRFPQSDELASIPQDPNNPLTTEKVKLGKLLFHEGKLAINPKLTEGAFSYSCASCHHSAAGFQAGIFQGIGEGGVGFGSNGEGRELNPDYPADSLDVQPIRSPTVLNTAYQLVNLWNGQFGGTGPNVGTEANWTVDSPKEANNLGYEGVETQAIAGLKVHRMGIDEAYITDSEYKGMFDAAFPNISTADRYKLEPAGLAIAAYERTILATEAPFQKWLRGDFDAMTDNQKKGAILFFEKAQCFTCHNGPALNSMEFYALGMRDLDRPGFYGNAPSDAVKKGRGGFTGQAADMYKFKVPQLYSLGYSPFYGHGASFSSVRQVIEYKNAGVKENAGVPDEQLAEGFKLLQLSATEIGQLTDFVENGLNDANLNRYDPTSLPSGFCIPNNDAQSIIDRECN